MSYKVYVDKLINMMYGNNDFGYNRIVFGETGKEIGKEIHRNYGYKGLFMVMNMLVEELTSEYNNSFLGDLRELEVCFDGICDE